MATIDDIAALLRGVQTNQEAITRLLNAPAAGTASVPAPSAPTTTEFSVNETSYTDHLAHYPAKEDSTDHMRIEKPVLDLLSSERLQPYTLDPEYQRQALSDRLVQPALAEPLKWKSYDAENAQSHQLTHQLRG